MSTLQLKIKIKQTRRNLRDIYFRIKCGLIVIFQRKKFHLTVLTKTSVTRHYIDTYNYKFFTHSQQEVIIDLSVQFANAILREEIEMNKVVAEANKIFNSNLKNAE